MSRFERLPGRAARSALETVVAAACVGAFLTGCSSAGQRARFDRCAEVVVAADPVVVPALHRLEDSLEESSQRAGAPCRRLRITSIDSARALERLRDGWPDPEHDGDRKSTRLNSSH